MLKIDKKSCIPVGSNPRRFAGAQQNQALITIRRPKDGGSGKVYASVLNFHDSDTLSLDLTQGTPPIRALNATKDG